MRNTRVLASHVLGLAMIALMGNELGHSPLTPDEREARRKQREQDEADDKRYREEQEAKRLSRIEAVAAPLRAERLARKRAAFAKRNSLRHRITAALEVGK